MTFVAGLVVLNVISLAGANNGYEWRAEKKVRSYDYMIDTIPSLSYKLRLRGDLVEDFRNFEVCTDERDVCNKKVAGLNDEIRTYLNDLRTCEKQIGVLKSELYNTNAILNKRTVSLQALILRTCEEFIEEGVFPKWLQELSITRKEKWLLAISCLQTRFAEHIRGLIKQQYESYESGVLAVATGMESIYEDISIQFAHPTAPQYVVIPTKDSEIEELCNAAPLKQSKATKAVCKLIFEIRNFVDSTNDVMVGQKPVTEQRGEAIFYGIIRRHRGTSFKYVKNALDTIPDHIEGCRIASHIFWSTKKNTPGETKTDAIITFKATCPETTFFTDFCEYTKTLLEPILNTKSSETEIQMIEDPICSGQLTTTTMKTTG